MKFSKLLKLLDPLVYVIIWTPDDHWENEDAEPSYKGSLYDMPWYFANMRIAKFTPEDDEPISFREDLGEDCNHRPGLVICLKDE